MVLNDSPGRPAHRELNCGMSGAAMFFCLMFLSAILAGCSGLESGRLYPKSGNPPVSSSELVKLKERPAFWRNYQCKFRMRVESKTSNFSSRVLVLVEAPNFVRFETFTALGQTAALYVFNETGPSLMIPSQNAIFTARLPETLASEFLGIDLPIDLLPSLLTASIPAEQFDHIESRNGSGGLRLISDRPGAYFEWQIAADPPALQTMLIRGKGFEDRVSYDPPVPLTKDAVPGRIRISSGEWTLEISVEELTPAPQFQPSAFYMPNLPDVRKVDLDKIK
jgi:outer membrane biogenesis lipoprotein LolB